MRHVADLPVAVWNARHHRKDVDTRAPETVLTPVVTFVIPVFNGAQTIAGVVAEIHAEVEKLRVPAFEFVLVNDGSADDSEAACLALTGQYRGMTYVHLDRNFGEHSAVLAGLAHARGHHICVMDDDGQHSAADALRLLSYLQTQQHDVVYATYPKRRHSAFRVAGSMFNDWLATLLLGKPAGLYLSSFKVMTRKIAMQLCEQHGSKPYLDALILHSTRNIGQLAAEHRSRRTGRSGYTFAKLVDLCLSMVLGARSSRIHAAAGCCAFGLTLMALLVAAVFTDWALFTPRAPEALTSLAATAAVIISVQIIALGGLARYLRKVLAHRHEAPPYVLRYVRYPEDRTTQRVADQREGRPQVGSISC